MKGWKDEESCYFLYAITSDLIHIIITNLCNNPEVIDKCIVAIALTIARSQPAPNGAPEDLCKAVQDILGGDIQPQEAHWGL